MIARTAAWLPKGDALLCGCLRLNWLRARLACWAACSPVKAPCPSSRRAPSVCWSPWVVKGTVWKVSAVHSGLTLRSSSWTCAGGGGVVEGCCREECVVTHVRTCSACSRASLLPLLPTLMVVTCRHTHVTGCLLDRLGLALGVRESSSWTHFRLLCRRCCAHSRSRSPTRCLKAVQRATVPCCWAYGSILHGDHLPRGARECGFCTGKDRYNKPTKLEIG
jgi:hypothetical protein